MAWTTNPYCQLSDVKLALGIATTDTADDVWLQALIPQAQAAMDEELGFSFQQDGPGATRVYDGQGLDVLMVDDCLAITQVLETTYNVFVGSTGVFTVGTTQTVDITADCILKLDHRTSYGTQLVRKTGMGFQEGTQNYQVTGTFGRPTIPTDIARACVRLVVHLYKLRSLDYGATPADGQFSPHSLRLVASWPADVYQTVCAYKPRLFLGR